MTHSTNEDAAVPRRTKRKRPRSGPRHLSLEPLEDRRLRAVFTVSNLNDASVAAPGDAPGTLRQAIYDANHTAGDDQIVFAGALTSGGPASINLSAAGQLSINSNVVITGPGANLLTVRAYDPTPETKDGLGARVLEIQTSAEGSRVTIQGLTLTGGDVQGDGGGIRTDGALKLVESKVTDNTASGTGMVSGGGIAVSSIGRAEVTDSTVSGNHANGDYSYGGGISSAGYLSLVRSMITGNHANRDGYTYGAGGGIAVAAVGSARLTDSTVSGNLAMGGQAVGGGIMAEGYLSLVRSMITGNKADGDSSSYGGGISVSVQAVVIDSQITMNDAAIAGSTDSGPSRGGGIESDSNLIISGSLISGNRAAESGGGLSLNFLASISNSIIHGNSAMIGGGIAGRENGIDNHITLTNSTVSGNTGDGIHNRGYSSVIGSSIVNNTGSGVVQYGGLFIATSTISNNFAGVVVTTLVDQGAMIVDSVVSGSIGGGGIDHVQLGGPLDLLEVTNSTVSGNTGPSFGGIRSTGGLALESSTVSGSTGTGVAISGNASILNSTISNNTGASGGGVSIAIGGAQTATIAHSTITANRASVAGGGIFATAGSGVALSHTIVAGNLLTSLARQDITGGLSARYSLIGDDTGATVNDLGGNQIGHAATPIDPQLGPLANNGGLNMTHVPLVGSVVIDAGDPAAMAGSGGVPVSDERGAPFVRVVDGKLPVGARIDIGAVEWQAQPVPLLIGDANRDGSVDAADYTIWRNTVGAMVEPYSGADFDGSGTIDANDYPLWKSHFGETLPPMASASGGGSLAAELTTAELATVDSLAAKTVEVVRPAATQLAPSVLAEPSLLYRPPNLAAPALVRTLTFARATSNDNLLAWLTSQDHARERRLALQASASIDDPASRHTEPFHCQAADAVFDALGKPGLDI